MKLLSALVMFASSVASACGHSESPHFSTGINSAWLGSVKLCSSSSEIDGTQAIRLRDQLSQPKISKEQLLTISGILSEAIERCSDTFKVMDAEMVSGLYVVLGNRFLSEKEYIQAQKAFGSSVRLLERFGVPSLMWLAALEGSARAKVLLGDLAGADKLAQIQTTLVRTWVTEKGFIRSALVDALRFEAEISHKKHQGDRAKALAEEADRIELQMDNDTHDTSILERS